MPHDNQPVHPAPERISLAKEMAGGYGEASSSGAASSSPVTVDDAPAVADWEGRVHLHFPFYQPNKTPKAADEWKLIYLDQMSGVVEILADDSARNVLTEVLSAETQTVSLDESLMKALMMAIEGFKCAVKQRYAIQLAILIHHCLPAHLKGALWDFAQKQPSCLSKAHWGLICGQPFDFVGGAQLTPIPLIHLATLFNNTSAITKLNALKADMNAVNGQGYSACSLAASYGLHNAVNQLILGGTDVNMTHKPDSEPPLFLAARGGHTKVVELLLAYGATVNQRLSRNGATSLHVAAENGHADIVRLLIAHGANVDQGLSTDGSTPLLISAQNGHADVVKILLDSTANVNYERSIDGGTPLLIAAQNGHTEVGHLLIAEGANVNYSCRASGVTSLFLAAESGHADFVELLIMSGANVDAECADGYRALYIAAQNGHKTVVELLLAHKADPDFECTNGGIPLFIAAQKGRIEIVELLIRAGADVNRSRTGDINPSPLMVASRNGHVEVVELLLQSGAYYDHSLNSTGSTAIHQATKGGHYKIVEILVAASEAGGACVSEEEGKLFRRILLERCKEAYRPRFFGFSENNQLPPVSSLSLSLEQAESQSNSM